VHSKDNDKQRHNWLDKILCRPNGLAKLLSDHIYNRIYAFLDQRRHHLLVCRWLLTSRFTSTNLYVNNRLKLIVVSSIDFRSYRSVSSGATVASAEHSCGSPTNQPAGQPARCLSDLNHSSPIRLRPALQYSFERSACNFDEGACSSLDESAGRSHQRPAVQSIR